MRQRREWGGRAYRARVHVERAVLEGSEPSLPLQFFVILTLIGSLIESALARKRKRNLHRRPGDLSPSRER